MKSIPHLTARNQAGFFANMEEGDVFTYNDAFFPRDVQEAAAKQGVHVEYCPPGTDEYKAHGCQTMKVHPFTYCESCEEFGWHDKTGRCYRCRNPFNLEEPSQFQSFTTKQRDGGWKAITTTLPGGQHTTLHQKVDEIIVTSSEGERVEITVADTEENLRSRIQSPQEEHPFSPVMLDKWEHLLNKKQKPHWYVLTDVSGVVKDWGYLTQLEAQKLSQQALAASDGELFWMPTWEPQEIIPRKAVEELKQYWLSNPFWDLEEMEGFEPVRKELYYFRLATERQWALNAWADTIRNASTFDDKDMLQNEQAERYQCRLTQQTFHDIYREVQA